MTTGLNDQSSGVLRLKDLLIGLTTFSDQDDMPVAGLILDSRESVAAMSLLRWPVPNSMAWPMLNRLLIMAPVQSFLILPGMVGSWRRLFGATALRGYR